ncbi:MAG: hypothetical protein JXR03_04920 [Cyclobacteriaceae bacterium]
MTHKFDLLVLLLLILIGISCSSNPNLISLRSDITKLDSIKDAALKNDKVFTNFFNKHDFYSAGFDEKLYDSIFLVTETNYTNLVNAIDQSEEVLCKSYRLNLKNYINQLQLIQNELFEKILKESVGSDYSVGYLNQMIFEYSEKGDYLYEEVLNSRNRLFFKYNLDNFNKPN